MSPIANPTSEFVRGWMKLPDELRMMILSFALPSGEKFDWLSFDKAQIDFKYTYMNDPSNTPLISPSMALRMAKVRKFQTDVFPLLACITTRDLVPEAFYPQNDFLILIALGNDTSHMKFPPVDVGKALRHVRIEIQCPEYGLDSLQLLAAGARRLPEPAYPRWVDCRLSRESRGAGDRGTDSVRYEATKSHIQA
jgi:hypothetical protein